MVLNTHFKAYETRCLEMALVHDLGESIIGDFTPHCKITKEEKHQKEVEAMKTISSLVGSSGDHIFRLFMEYEDQSTPEAKLVRELDLFDMCLQAFEYEKKENQPGKLQEFIDSTNGKFAHPSILKLHQEMTEQRNLFLKSNEL